MSHLCEAVVLMKVILPNSHPNRPDRGKLDRLAFDRGGASEEEEPYNPIMEVIPATRERESSLLLSSLELRNTQVSGP